MPAAHPPRGEPPAAGDVVGRAVDGLVHRFGALRLALLQEEGQVTALVDTIGAMDGLDQRAARDARERDLIARAKAGDEDAREELGQLRRDYLQAEQPALDWDAEKDLARQAGAGDSAAREQLIEAHRAHLAELVRQRTTPLEDRDAALSTAVRAIQDHFGEYDVNRGYRFRLWYPHFVTQAIASWRAGAGTET